jgi:Beta-ketoacyl synthase, N-terminal domain
LKPQKWERSNAMPQFSTGDGFPDVVVTGIAMTTALATEADNTWKKLLDGQSGIRKLDDPFIEQFDLPVRIGGHLLEDFDHELTRVELHRYLVSAEDVDQGPGAWQPGLIQYPLECKAKAGFAHCFC